MTDPYSFGDWLRRERERRAITVRAIADRTKISYALLEALERGDVSRWPAGIYRRAFVRSYAESIGLDAELVLANFERLFPDPEAPRSDRSESTSSSDASNGSTGGELRLQLAARPALPGAAVLKRACFDVAFALVIGLIGFAAVGPLGFWCATAVAALVYHTFGVLGIRSSMRRRTRRPQPADSEPVALPRPVAPVMQFSGDMPVQTRRARARRMVATISAAALPHVAARRRNELRS
jgi:transcriptional regulator with XRE-family HTH domain